MKIYVIKYLLNIHQIYIPQDSFDKHRTVQRSTALIMICNARKNKDTRIYRENSSLDNPTTTHSQYKILFSHLNRVDCLGNLIV